MSEKQSEDLQAQQGPGQVNEAAGSAKANGRKKKGGEKEKKSLGREILEWVFTLLVAVVAALVIRGFIFEPVRVDGASMNDTLRDGDIMFVSKWDYNSVWLSMPWQSDEAKESAPRLASGLSAPQRFDVVVCRYPNRGDTNFVKRIIGLPGDELYIEDGYLWVNGEKYDEPYINDEYRVRGGSNGWAFASAEEPYKVPEGEYFVMGDHRNNSNDSRAQGTITRDMIVGHVRFVFFPFSAWRGVK